MAKEKPEIKWNEDTQEWERNEAYNCKMFLDALDRKNVIVDAKITFYRQGRKLKAYCSQVDANLQWPSALRRIGKTYTADIIKAEGSRGTFYRYYRGSIRDGHEVIK